jgi:protein-tyrosine kinase
VRDREGSINLISLEDEKSPVTEAYRTLRTNIQFADMGNKLKTLLITSPEAGDGKTTTTANLAVVMAQAGHKILLIDGDLRKPTINFLFKTSNRMGLTELLIKGAKIEDVIKTGTVDNLKIITAGRIPPNPSELLSSEQMGEILGKLKKQFDLILIDGPPIIPVTDAQLLSRTVDGVLLVVKSRKSSSILAQKAKGLIEHVGGNIMGVVLNNKKMQLTKYQY